MKKKRVLNASLKEHGILSALIFLVISFAATWWGSTHPLSTAGIKDLPDLIWSAIFFGTIFGLVDNPSSSYDFSRKEKLIYKLFSFLYFVLCIMLGGGLALLWL